MATLFELGSKRRHAIAGGVVIGRGDSCEIRIDDPMVSPTHATIVEDAGSYRIRDLDSRRGIYVGATKVTDAPLRDGDELLIGPVRMRFEATRPPIDKPGDSEELIRLRAIVELGRSIGVEHDLERLLGRVLTTCFQLLRADRGAIVIYEPHSKSPFMTIARDRKGQPYAVSSSVLGQVMITHEPYLRTEIGFDLALQRAESLMSEGVRSVMAVPLSYQAGDTEWLGVIMLDAGAAKGFQPRDLELLEAIAGPAALAIKNAMLVRHVQSVIGDEWRRLERVVRDLPLGVVVLDDKRRCVLVNQWVAGRRELGQFQSGEVVEAIAGVPTTKLMGADMRTTVTTESDRILSISTNAMSDGRETVLVIADLTEERERQQQAAHKDRVALVGQLAGGVAHDFNNLLHVILTYANMLEETLEDADQRDDAHQITHAATSAAELTKQLLTFSRRELVKPKVIEVPHVVLAMEQLLRRTVGPQIELDFAVAPRIPRILMDGSQLEQILMNLVVNARDAIAGSGVVRVAVTAKDVDEELAALFNLPPGRYVGIEVSDTGSGMQPDVAARIFEPYFTTKARNKGTGLGLATVHGIVQQAGGEIRVDSVVGHGTSFQILLPATEQPSEQRAVLDAAAGTATILVVDDDDNVRRATERILRSAGYSVLSASSGHNALTLAREHQGVIDLLLTDIVMPGLSGRDLAREIVAAQTTERVLFMSGYHQHAPIGDSQFISKPFQRADLLDKVRTVLASEVARTI